MQSLAFIAAGAVGLSLAGALAQALGLRFAVPDVAVLVAVFCALRRSPVSLTLIAAALGYLAGRQALAPDGVGPLALVVVAVATFLASGSLAGGGRGFYVLACLAGSLGFQGLLWGLALLTRGGAPAGQAGALVGQALATALCAGVVEPLLGRLEAALAPSRREGLRWR